HRRSGARAATRYARASWCAVATPGPRHPRCPAMSERSRAPALAALAGLPLLASCATLVQGSTQMGQVSSTPSGARVLVLPENAILITPGKIDLARNQVHTLVFMLPCYQPATGYLDRVDSKTVLLDAFAGAIPGLVVDFSTGAAYELTPDPLHVNLKRASI